MNKTIIISVATVAVLTFSGCGNKSNEESTQNNTTTTVEKTTQAVKEAANKVAETTKEVATKTTQKAEEVAKKAVEATKEAADATVNKAKEVAQKAVEATKKVEESKSSGNDKGKAVYAKCVSCHGADGKTKALGKSEVIAGQAVADLEKKLSEYKAGTRNVAGMGTLMNGQVKGLSDDDIKAVAEYISSLK